MSAQSHDLTMQSSHIRVHIRADKRVARLSTVSNIYVNAGKALGKRPEQYNLLEKWGKSCSQVAWIDVRAHKLYVVQAEQLMTFMLQEKESLNGFLS